MLAVSLEALHHFGLFPTAVGNLVLSARVASRRSEPWLCPGAGSDGTFYQVRASAMSLMELVHDALLYPRETKYAPLLHVAPLPIAHSPP